MTPIDPMLQKGHFSFENEKMAPHKNGIQQNCHGAQQQQ